AASSPPPLWGRDREGGTPLARESVATPLPTPPPQGGREPAAPSREGSSRTLSADVKHRPITLLIAALGGEGGGVLTNWIVRAAEQLAFPVQSTSIPGVAQRTGG